MTRRSAASELTSRVIHLPYTLEQDEDGCGAVGDGTTPEEAIADLREALTLLIEEVGAPPGLTLTLDVT